MTQLIEHNLLHGCATTTQTVRRAIQNSQESLKTFSERYGINKKTVAKWRKRDFVHDAPMGPKHPRSTVLTPFISDYATSGPNSVMQLTRMGKKSSCL